MDWKLIGQQESGEMSIEVDYRGKKIIKETKVLAHGFVKLLDIMGSDEEVEDAARISYGEGKKGKSDA